MGALATGQGVGRPKRSPGSRVEPGRGPSAPAIRSPTRRPGRLLVTGGAGFLGGHLLPLLSRKLDRCEIRVTDIRSTPPPDLPEGAAYLGGIDILDADSLAEAMRGVDSVIHLAGLISFRRDDRDRLFSVNGDGTRSVAVACLRAGVERLVHISSVAAVGFNNRQDDPAGESLSFDWGRARSKHYMCSKRAGEEALREAAAAGLSVVIANPGAIHGPGNRQFAGLYRRVRRRRVRHFPPGGTNVVDVRDVSEGLRLLLLSRDCSGRFILGGHNLSYREILSSIARAVGAPPPRRRLPVTLHKPLRAVADTMERLWPGPLSYSSDLVDSWFQYRYFTSRKAERILGWRPTFSFDETVRDSAREMAESGLLDPPGVGGIPEAP